MIDWLFTVLRPAQGFFTYMETSPLPVRAIKFRPMLGAQGLWVERDLYRATPTVTRDLGFSGLIRRTAPFSRLLRHTRGCGGSILTRILTGYSLWLPCQKYDYKIVIFVMPHESVLSWPTREWAKRDNSVYDLIWEGRHCLSCYTCIRIVGNSLSKIRIWVKLLRKK
jgi:hypothetical protein